MELLPQDEEHVCELEVEDEREPLSPQEQVRTAQTVQVRKTTRNWKCAVIGCSLLMGALFLVSFRPQVKAIQGDAGQAVQEVENASGHHDEPSEQQPLPAVMPHRRGSFMVIGDWGWDNVTTKIWAENMCTSTTCVSLIAQTMHETFMKLGDVKFIINVGDSFYPGGVTSKNDKEWDLKWRNIFSKELRSVPWYSVYGNHDYQHDPCACGNRPEDCAQINNNSDNLDFFYMPDLNWHKEHEDLDVEVVGLDMGMFEDGWNSWKIRTHQAPAACHATGCYRTCVKNLRWRSEDGIKLLRDRVDSSTAKNMLVFSHYPTDYFRARPEILRLLRDDSRHIEYFGGHRHSTDNTSTVSIHPNSNWLVGGGGGWSCDTADQGFVVGEISHDAEIQTYRVLVDEKVCCPKKYGKKQSHEYIL